MQSHSYNGRGRAGFTLIEFIVSIAILTILATVVQLGVAMILPKVRDGRRIADLQIMVTALRQYRFDNDTYPVENRDTGMWTFSYDDDFLHDLVPSYLQRPPKDPLNDAPDMFDWFNGQGHYYAYFYYAKPDYQSIYFGCGDENFSVIGVRQLERGRPPNAANAYCGPPQPFACPPWGIPYVCRDWGLEFDTSVMFYDSAS